MVCFAFPELVPTTSFLVILMVTAVPTCSTITTSAVGEMKRHCHSALYNLTHTLTVTTMMLVSAVIQVSSCKDRVIQTN